MQHFTIQSHNAPLRVAADETDSTQMMTSKLRYELKSTYGSDNR